MGDKLHKAAGVFEAEDSTEFYRRLVLAGRVPDGTLAFLNAA
jgi:hypothetical protein